MSLDNGTINVTKEAIYDMLGVPIGGSKIEVVNRSDHDDVITSTWKSQFEKGIIRPTDVLKRIGKSTGREFILNFLVLFATCMAEGNKLGSCNLKFLPFITKDVQIQSLDWCGYIYDCLKVSKVKWNRGANGRFYSGPLTILMVNLFFMFYIPVMNNQFYSKNK